MVSGSPGPEGAGGKPASGSVSHWDELRYLGIWGPGGLGHLSGPRPSGSHAPGRTAPRLQAGAREPRPDSKLPAKAPAGNASGRPAGVPAPGQCDFIGPPRLLAATGQGLQAGATAPRIAMWPIGIVDVGHRISVGCMRLHIASRDYPAMQRQLGERTVTMPLRTEAFEYDSSS